VHSVSTTSWLSTAYLVLISLHTPDLAPAPPDGVTTLQWRGGFVWSKNPESCAGSSFATGRVSHAGLVEVDYTN
jgi:hypothetical protein